MMENGKISSVGSGQTNRVLSADQNKYKAAMSESQESVVQSDMATVSAEAQVLAKSLSVLNEVDDVRQEKVTAIKNKIETGTYEINYQNIALKIQGVLEQIPE
jgi:negative regulator of flagellin synthesis FlgM